MTVSRPAPRRASTAKSYRHILATTGPRIVLALSAGALLAGCGAGQITQTANQLPAVNGAEFSDSDIALRNVHIVLTAAEPIVPADEETTSATTTQAEPTTEATTTEAEAGTDESATTTSAAPAAAGQLLVFTAINQATATTDRLVTIETDAADQVVISPSSGDALELRPQASLTTQSNSGTGAALAASTEGSGETSSPVTVTLVGTTDAVRPGLTVPVTFVFERAGALELNVPVDGGPLLERNDDAILEDHGPLSGPNAGGGH